MRSHSNIQEIKPPTLTCHTLTMYKNNNGYKRNSKNFNETSIHERKKGFTLMASKLSSSSLFNIKSNHLLSIMVGKIL